MAHKMNTTKLPYSASRQLTHFERMKMRDMAFVRAENRKRDTICRLHHALTERLGDADKAENVTFDVLGVMMPNVTIRTLVAARRGEFLPEPTMPTQDELAELVDSLEGTYVDADTE